ncbi:MAG: hypothetical protein ACP5T0_05295 [Verrucomicrobiia bacterium]
MNIYRKIVILFAGIVLAAILIFGVSCFIGYQLCLKEAEKIDELDWLKKEYKLSDTDVEEIRKLHSGYRLVCEQMCARIAEKKRALEIAMEKSTNVTPEIEKLLVDIGTYRAQCQASMLKHFYEVSAKMPPDQGEHYFKKMRTLVLEGHEKIEESMAGKSNGASHSHH